MTAILINGLAGLMLILFGLMAIAPFLISSQSTSAPASSTAEDRVLNISPVPMIERIRPHAGNQPVPLGDVAPHDDSSKRDAA